MQNTPQLVSGEIPQSRGFVGERPYGGLAPSRGRVDGGAVEDAGLDGEAIQLRSSLEAELLSQAGAVRLDGLHAHADSVRDLLIGMALRQQPQHFALAPAQVPRLLGLGPGAARDCVVRRVQRLRE